MKFEQSFKRVLCFGSLSCLLVSSTSATFVMAKPRTPNKAALLQGLIEQKPVFDTSLQPFQLFAEHKTIRKNKSKPILQVRDNLNQLRTEAKDFGLKAQTARYGTQTFQSQTDKNAPLEGQVDKNGRPLKAQLDMNGKPLQAQLDKNGKPLQGQVDRNGRPLQAQVDKNGTPLTAQLDKNGKPLTGKVDASGKPLTARVDTNGKPLTAKVDASGKPLTGKADINGKPLTAQVDTNKPLQAQTDRTGKPLQTLVVETPRSPLTTQERFHPPFHLDLRKLTEDIAPDIATRMELEVGKARRQTAANVVRQEKVMNEELKGRKPVPDVIPPAPKTTASLALTHAVDSEISKAKQQSQISDKDVNDKMKGPPGTLPKGPGMPPIPSPTKLAFLPKFPGFGFGSDKTKSSTQEMDAQLAHVNQTKATSNALDSQLAAAKQQSRLAVTAATPGMDAILTHSRSLPGTAMPTIPKGSAPADGSDVVPWDQWHAHFAELARNPILANVSKSRNPSGSDTVQITVWRNHRIDVKLSAPSNAEFDRAILAAYKSLGGNAGLEFPKNSRRQSITFLVDNEHKNPGAPSGVSSQTSRGDKEVIRSPI